MPFPNNTSRPSKYTLFQSEIVALHTSRSLRQYNDNKTLSKIHKKHYDKIHKNFTSLLFAEILMEKSCNLNIYKSALRVYNESPE